MLLRCSLRRQLSAFACFRSAPSQEAGGSGDQGREVDGLLSLQDLGNKWPWHMPWPL